MGKVLATAGWGEGERARDGNVLLADLQCVRFGGAVVTSRGTEGSSSNSRTGSQPPVPWDQLGARWEPQGSRSPAACRAVPVVGWVCFVSGSQ